MTPCSRLPRASKKTNVQNEPAMIAKMAGIVRPVSTFVTQYQAENDEPQPQVRLAFGLTNLNPAPCNPWT